MKKIILIISIVLGLVSCENYLDVNVDPNAPSSENVSSEMIFPGAEMNVVASYGDFLRIVGGYYSQQYCQTFGTSNYLDFSQFIMSATRSSGTYEQMFKAIKNFEIIRQKSKSKENWGTYLAATTMKVFAYQALIDAYGELPYTEALDAENTSPKYDDGKTIYNGLLAELDEALNKAKVGDLVTTNMLFKTKTAKEWIQFANALELKMLMRMSGVENVKSKVDGLIAKNNFPATDIAYVGIWADETGKANPFYQEEYATYFGSTQVNVVGNIAYIETLKSVNDKRLSAFYGKNENGEYKGGVSGTNFSTSQQYKSGYFCRPVATFDMPVNLINRFEIDFFLAEHYAKNGDNAKAKQHYEAAVTASFANAGVTGANDILQSAEYKWDATNYQKIIGIQKWIALGGTNNYEAWCELRRLKFPAFGTVRGDELYNESNDTFSENKYQVGTLYTPIKYNIKLGANKVLQRFKYPENSVTRNSNASKTVEDNVPVFWVK